MIFLQISIINDWKQWFKCQMSKFRITFYKKSHKLTKVQYITNFTIITNTLCKNSSSYKLCTITK